MLRCNNCHNQNVEQDTFRHLLSKKEAVPCFTHQLNFESAGERFEVELVTFRHLLNRKNQSHFLLPANTVKR